MKIVLTGGGTGGHLLPLAAVAKKISEKIPQAEFLFLGPHGKMEKELMAREGIPAKTVLSGKFRRYFSFHNFVDFLKIPVGVIQSLWILLFYMPDAIFSKGGYASIPVVLAGWLYRIPILIHESDSVPGVANSMLGKFADRVAVSYPEAEREFPAAQVVLTGNPLREDIGQGDAARARESFYLTQSKKVIFVMGGSQGAQSINEKIIKILPDLLHAYQVIHQTGENNFKTVEHRAAEFGIKAGRDGYFAIPTFGEEIKDILAVSDLVVSRAGANSISEIAANGKPAILIPLEGSAGNHQKMNAYSLARMGGCIVLEETNLGEHMLLQKIRDILENEEVKQKLSQNIRAFYHADAAEKIADGILGMVK
jgi:UDP-N-acetylglucosamine--N-acetylmuramyl-(pentapeptide) pyrophosphoryl-undecaprenol N-acetylglucosamine transferase